MQYDAGYASLRFIYAAEGNDSIVYSFALHPDKQEDIVEIPFKLVGLAVGQVREIGVEVVKEETTEKRQKDMPSRLNARRKIMKKVNKVKDAEGNNIDVPAKLFNEIAPKYAGKNVGGYTRIIKAGPRRGDAAEVAILQLV